METILEFLWIVAFCKGLPHSFERLPRYSVT